MGKSEKLFEVNAATDYGVWNFPSNVVQVIVTDGIVTDRNNKIRNADSDLLKENKKITFQLTHGIVERNSMQSVNDIGTSCQPGRYFCNKACLGFMGVNDVYFFSFDQPIIKHQGLQIIPGMNAMNKIVANNHLYIWIPFKRIFLH